MYVSKRHFLKNAAALILVCIFLLSYFSANLIKAPVGEKPCCPSSGFAPLSNIVKINTENNKISKIILDQGKGSHYDATVEVIHDSAASVWQNSFLCS